MQQAVARRHDAPRRVDARPVHRMQHRADQSRGRARRQARVAVEREEIARPRQRVALAEDADGGLLVGQEPRQREQRAAFPLLALPAAAVEAAGAGEEIKAAAEAQVERGDRLARRGEHGLVGLRLRRVGGGQVGQDPELQVRPRPPLQQAKLLQPTAERGGALRVGQQGRDHAERFALRRHALREIQPRQAAGRDRAQQREVKDALHQLRYGEEQQGRGPGIPGGEGQQQAQKEARQHDGRDVQPRARAARLVEEQKAQMPFFGPRLFQQPPRQDLLLQPLGAGARRQPVEIVCAALAVHARVNPAGILREDRVAEVGGAQQLLHVRPAEPAQRGEQRLKGLGLRGRVGGEGEGFADGGHRLCDRGAHRRGEEQQLAPPQRRHGLEAAQEDRTARPVQLPAPRLQQRQAQRAHQQPVSAAALPPGAAQIAQRGARLPLQKIEVVQQPLAGRGDRLRPPVAPPQRLGAAPHGGVMPSEPRRLGLSAALAVERQELRAVGGEGAEPLVFDIESGKESIHVAPRKTDSFPVSPKRAEICAFCRAPG